MSQKMKRPLYTDENIVRYAVDTFVENKNDELWGEYYTSEAGKESFIKDLFNAAKYGETDCVKLAIAYAKSNNVDSELSELMEEFIGHHESVHSKTITDWMKGWGPKQPFEENARVVLKDKFNETSEGLATIRHYLCAKGEMVFVPDNEVEKYCKPDGALIGGYIRKWEEVIEIKPLSDQDLILLSKTDVSNKEAQVRSMELNKQIKASQVLNDKIKKHSVVPPNEAEELYRLIGGNPEAAAKAIVAIKQMALKELEFHEEAPRIAQPMSNSMF